MQKSQATQGLARHIPRPTGPMAHSLSTHSAQGSAISPFLEIPHPFLTAKVPQTISWEVAELEHDVAMASCLEGHRYDPHMQSLAWGMGQTWPCLGEVWMDGHAWRSLGQMAPPAMLCPPGKAEASQGPHALRGGPPGVAVPGNPEPQAADRIPSSCGAAGLLHSAQHAHPQPPQLDSWNTGCRRPCSWRGA